MELSILYLTVVLFVIVAINNSGNNNAKGNKKR